MARYRRVMVAVAAAFLAGVPAVPGVAADALAGVTDPFAVRPVIRPVAECLELAAGIGYVQGDVTYEIGGNVEFADGGRATFRFPISRLEWPVEALLVWAEGTVWFGNSLSLSATVSANADRGSGSLRDSDWIDVDDPTALTVYSESDIALEYAAIDGALWWWCFPSVAGDDAEWRAALGAGLLLQHMAWDVSNTDQWYPREPARDHDYYAGSPNATYTVDLAMPYVGASALWHGGAWRVETGIDLAPWLSLDDSDDHRLRYILAETQAEGWGWRARGALQRDFSRRWFVRLGVSVLRLEADGRQKTITYGGWRAGNNWTIDHELTSALIGGACTLGASF